MVVIRLQWFLQRNLFAGEQCSLGFKFKRANRKHAIMARARARRSAVGVDAQAGTATVTVTT